MVRKPVVLEDGHLVTPKDVARWLARGRDVLEGCRHPVTSPFDSADVEDALEGLTWALAWVRAHEDVGDAPEAPPTLDDPDLWDGSDPSKLIV